MLPVTDEEVAAFHSGLQKQLTLTFSDGTVITNDAIASGSMSIEQSICEDQSLIFGQVSSSCFKVDLLGVTKRYKNLGVSVTISADGYDVEGEPTTYTRKLGTYTVISDEATSNRLARNLECYDALYDILPTNYADWHNSQPFPMTLKAYRDAFFNHIGIEQVDIELVNDNMIIEKNFVAENYSGSDLLYSICEVNACFGHMDWDGKFKYVMIIPNFKGLYPANDLYPNDELYPVDPEAFVLRENSYFSGGLKYEEFETKAITMLQIKMTEDDLGIEVGSAGNTYIIQNNPLLYGKTSAQLRTVANNIFPIIRLVYYTPSSVKLQGCPWYELGDMFKLVSAGNSIYHCVLHRKLTGITALFDTYDCDGTEYYSQDNANSVYRNITVLKQRTNELYRDAEQTRSTLTAIDTKLDGEIETRQSQIKQTADAITAEVTRATRSEGNLSSRITQTADAIKTKVSKNSVISSINQSAEEIKINANKITLTGYVTFNDLATSNPTKTIINGDNITTGTIACRRIVSNSDSKKEVMGYSPGENCVYFGDNPYESGSRFTQVNLQGGSRAVVMAATATLYGTNIAEIFGTTINMGSYSKTINIGASSGSSKINIRGTIGGTYSEKTGYIFTSSSSSYSPSLGLLYNKKLKSTYYAFSKSPSFKYDSGSGGYVFRDNPSVVQVELTNDVGFYALPYNNSGNRYTSLSKHTLIGK